MDNKEIIADPTLGNNNSVGFTLTNLLIGSDPYSVEGADQWFDDNGWRINSEYSADSGKKKNAYILLLLDTSKSLGKEADTAKETAYQIIEYISKEM
jgi:hypothetical protein